MARFLRLTVAVACAAILAGACASAPPDGESRISFQWEIYPETDPCGKLAGSLALIDILGIEMSDEFSAGIIDQLESRCPEDTEPEAFDIDLIIPESTCADLRRMLELASAFNVTDLVAQNRQRMAGAIIDNLDREIERRCPPDYRLGPSSREPSKLRSRWLASGTRDRNAHRVSIRAPVRGRPRHSILL